jgi:hypothetical protein
MSNQISHFNQLTLIYLYPMVCDMGIYGNVLDLMSLPWTVDNNRSLAIATKIEAIVGWPVGHNTTS